MEPVKLNKIIYSVKELAESPNPYVDWNQFWLDYKMKVCKIITWLSTQFIFDYQNTQIAEYLKDLALFENDFFNKNLTAISLKSAKKILKDNNFSKDDIDYIVNDIISEESNLIESKIVRNAEAFYELKSDFILQIIWNRYSFEEKTLKQSKEWLLDRLDNNLKNITLEVLKNDAAKYYYSYKNVIATI